MYEIMEYLQTRKLLENEKHAHKFRVQVVRFTPINDSLYSQSFRRPYLKCLSNPQAQYILAKLHEGVCGKHPSGRTLVHRAHTQ